MTRTPIISAFVCISIAASGFALAQGDGDQGAQRRAQEQRNGQQAGQRGNQAAQQRQRGQQAQRQPGQQAQRADQRRPQARNQYYRPAGPGQEERGAGPDQNWHRGDRLPADYRNRNHVVDDWRAHRLSAPPRGYHWVQHGSDYLLVAIATGIIAQLLLDH